MSVSAVPSVAELWQRRRRSMLVVLISILCAALVLVLGFITQRNERPEPYALNSYAPNGTSALANILGQQGVELHEADSAVQVQQLLADYPDATVFLLDHQRLLAGAPTARLEDLAETVPEDQLIIFGTDSLEPLGPALEFRMDFEDTPVPPGQDCPLDEVRDVSQIPSYVSRVESSTATPCFATDDKAIMLVDDHGTVVVSTPEMLTNQELDQEDNPALVLRLAARNEHLIWYVPGIADVVDPNTQAVPLALPAWVRYGMAWALVVALIIMVWRGRRHGPVVTEPLPITVSSTETTVGRGRLAHRGRQRADAITTLQKASLHRMATRLKFGPAPDPEAVVTSVADTLGEPRDEIATLFSEQPASDTQLAQQARALHNLENRLKDHLG